MFSIKKLPPTEGAPQAQTFGEIIVGDFVERFSCYESIPPAPDWKVELQRLVDGASSVALVHDPRFAWVLYREDEQCLIQQHFFPNGCFKELRRRETIDEDGNSISEWSTTLDEISKFLKR